MLFPFICAMFLPDNNLMDNPFLRSLGILAAAWVTLFVSSGKLVDRAMGGEAVNQDNYSSDHWAFQPIVRPALPDVKNSVWSRNSMDRFILARIEKKGLTTSPVADDVTLLRRLALDLTGLPPSLSETERFLADHSPNAYERAVDRLLASPHFGERWGRHWLDGARYADSDGYEGDGQRSLWTYRDWVIDALNHDLPFDQFVIQQLAGDLIEGVSVASRIATGFLRANKGSSQPGNRDMQGLIDRTNTVGSVFMGLTVGCAQCHDHKIDPISQREYYQLFAFFNNSNDPFLELATSEEVAERDAHRERQKTLDSELEHYEKELAKRVVQSVKELDRLRQMKQGSEVEKLISKPWDQLDASQRKLIRDGLSQLDEEFKQRIQAVANFQDEEPQLVSTLVVDELPQPRTTQIFVRGVFLELGEVVQPNVPRTLPEMAVSESFNRLDLARWLTASNHPLTRRVAVNRIWQQYFGIGIVETDENFGLGGATPSHPNLLNYLADRMEGLGWSLKNLHRLIVVSATYRQSSHIRQELAEQDPRNRLLARQSRLRLEAEIVRDVALASSGLLNDEIGGPSVYPYQDDSVMKGRADRGKWEMSSGSACFRRGMYTHFWRLTPHPFLRAFDIPDANESCTRRQRSNTPLQALTLLNDPWYTEFAIALADRVLRVASASDKDRIEHVFRFCLSRAPEVEESAILSQLLVKQRESLSSEPERAVRLIESVSVPTTGDPQELAVWTAIARVVLNMDEYITRE